jgi:hypothetical protein
MGGGSKSHAACKKEINCIRYTLRHWDVEERVLLNKRSAEVIKECFKKLLFHPISLGDGVDKSTAQFKSSIVDVFET